MVIGIVTPVGSNTSFQSGICRGSAFGRFAVEKDRRIIHVGQRSWQNASIFGLSWGDEGKGKIVDLLCPAFDVVVRYNGGANAGHTVCVGSETFALHLLPSGVLHKGVESVIASGVVVDPIALVGEIDSLAERGVDCAERLKLSDRAHLVMPYHKIEDQLSEQRAGDDKKIGTTARGIGPCYADKMRRTTAIRVADMLSDTGVADKVRSIVEVKKTTFAALYGTDGDLDAENILTGLMAARDRLSSCVCDTTAYLQKHVSDGKAILFEGANGMLLDVDFGTYPFVTSSSTGPHGIGPGTGISTARIPCVIGVTKAYATRVGSGPFVSELTNETGDRIRKQGHEFGTTTGRPRRCGWFDTVSCRYAAAIGGATDLALMHLDTLSGFDEIGICTAYRIDGKTISTPPADASMLDRAEPIIELVPGWDADLRKVRRFEDLPEPTLDYIKRIEALIGVPVSLAGVGPDRSQALVRGPLRDVIHLPEACSV